MINLKIKNAPSFGEELIKNINEGSFKNFIKVIPECTLEEYLNLPSAMLKNHMYIITDDFADIDEDDFFDFGLKVIENKSKIFFENFESLKENEDLFETAEDIGLSFYIINLEFEVNLSDPNINVFYAFSEIFKKQNVIALQKSINSFETVNVILDNNCLTINGEEKVVNSSIEVFETIFKNIKFVSIQEKEHVFNNYLPSTNSLLFENSEVMFEKIQKFKTDVFNKIKDIEEDDYFKMHSSIKEELAEIEYIPFGRIKNVLKLFDSLD